MPSRTKSLTRVFIAFPAVIIASCLAAASTALPSEHACAGLGGPSNFDYLVLASIADSPHLLAMAGYRSASDRRDAPRLRPANYSPRPADYL